MVAIYKYENGLKFTGMIAESAEKADEYLGNKFGYWYKGVFYPDYNKNAFVFREVELVDPDKQEKSTRQW